MLIVLCALLWNEGGENFSKPTVSVYSAARIMTLGSPLVRVECTDEVYGTIFQAVIAHRLSTQCFRSKVVSGFIYTILGLLLAVVMVMLLHRPVYVWFHRSWGAVVCYIHDQDGKK